MIKTPATVIIRNNGWDALTANPFRFHMVHPEHANDDKSYFASVSFLKEQLCIVSFEAVIYNKQ